MLAPKPQPADDLQTDQRWQLVQRILTSAPFQKSVRLRELLEYITERTIHGHSRELNEQHIGDTLYHRPSGFSSLEDSSVRVHARQLRLKLHEYFDEDGRSEPLIVTIPKGSYTPVFKPAATTAVPTTEVERKPGTAELWRNRAVFAWTLCVLLAAACGVFTYEFNRHTTTGAATYGNPPWPLSQVFDARHQTVIVVADSNYGMFRILTSQPGSLDQYLRREFLQGTAAPKPGGADARLTEYISNSTLTSFADVADVAALLNLAGPMQKRVSIRYPRDLGMRDLDHDNYIFIGSPASNPWVSLFQSKLNFRESEGIVGNSAKAFVNTSPLPGEKARYEGLRWTGTMGEDYATIALLPNVTHDGNVLTLQGLQQEGTEAAGRFLADAEDRRQLKIALGIPPSSESVSETIWFEALIRSRTVAGAPNSTALVAARRIR
jgi:predicted outer membrane lipoprotein